jgi:hypothetical protein
VVRLSTVSVKSLLVRVAVQLMGLAKSFAPKIPEAERLPMVSAKSEQEEVSALATD